MDERGTHAPGDSGRSSPLADVSQAVRVGAPSSLRGDAFFYLIRGSWLRLLALMAAAYVTSNAVFAALYLARPDSIAGAEPGSFLDAFFFSVQTMSTIGYGAMAPATTWGNILVTVEAGVGLLGVAMATGVAIAKVSRPSASVVFSDCAVVTRRHGRPTLMFRLGNARGNDIVEAHVRVVALLEDESPEGHRMRLLEDLTLRRDYQPMFALTWTVMHEIDDASPLRHLASDGDDGTFSGIVVIMTGHDGTFGQTVHARHLYPPQRVQVGRRLVDTVSTRADGRLVVDYRRFHETAAETAKITGVE